MIIYELLILYRALPKAELRPLLKRTADAIYDKGGIIRKLENLGTRNMPFRTTVHGQVFNTASYFLYEFYIPPPSVDMLLDEFGRDVDIIRRRIQKKNEPINFECTLDEELQPPPYREDVKKLMEEANKTEKRKKPFNFGLKYYPFQR